MDFRLLMTDKRDEMIVPPPAYAFAPYYIDQDRSWTSAWASFTGMYLSIPQECSRTITRG